MGKANARHISQQILSSAALVAVMLTSGCGLERLGDAAPFFNMGTKTQAGGVMVAQSGDTVESLARRYSLSASDIIAANKLQAPYKLVAGQRLVVPRPASYKVRPKDTLYNVARMFNIAPDELAQYNGLNAPYSLNVGQVLRIPHPTGGSGHEAGFTTFTIEETTPLEPQKVDPVAVEPLSQKQNKQAQQKVFAANAAPSEVQELPVAEALSAMIRSVAAGEIADVKPVDMPKTTVNTNPTMKTDGNLSKTAMIAARPNAPIVQTTITPAAKAGYVWPVRGKIISSYGAKAGNLFNDGINIAAPRGTPVQAASDGVVAYVGSDLASYGNLVLIRHGNGMMTAYAHMQNTIVTKGETVKMGRVIGAVGASGSVNNSQLHFEIRRGRKSIDPAGYLGVSS